MRIVGARQHNLKNLTLELPTHELVVVTGVSGSGKSSLVFDSLYAEGQRRYVETFSPYARQFLDRMDRPQVDRIEGIPPAIAIDQTNPVRSSRSTVGTMTELNDHLKLLYARAARLYCRGCGTRVERDTPDSIYAALVERAAAAGDPRLEISFPVAVPANFSADEITSHLARQCYTDVSPRPDGQLEVVQDRLRMSRAERVRVIEALEAALRVGRGRVNVQAGEALWRFSADLHCAECDIHYAEPTPASFSFNSPLGACEICRGFGRVIGIDHGLVVPDESKTLRDGAIKPWQTQSYRECQDDLEKYADLRGIPLDRPFRELSAHERRWVLEGEPEWVSWERSWPGTWYGVSRFFAWLESKSYKMHIRVLLSKYRAYTPCPACGGSRLKPDAALWRLGGTARTARSEAATTDGAPAAGWTLHELMLQPVEDLRRLFDTLLLPAPLDEATDLLLAEIRARLGFLCDVGLGYLALDRQSRSLSGGEVQRINLTTALGTSLVNALFVLDEPSIGLHPRDMARVIAVMRKLREAGNSLVVVEHDPQIMLCADHILEMGPGPGERGGNIVFYGTPDALRAADTLTAQYLSGRKRAGGGASAAVPDPATPWLKIWGAAQNNLQNIDVAFPLRRLVCLSGVSGSGKSTLLQDVLYPALLKAQGKPTEAPGAYRDLTGQREIAEVVMVDQSAIGKTTRSNPVSYVGAFEPIRALFAAAPLARERGYTAGTFSFNAGQNSGRCPSCSGSGFEHVEMQFLSDVYLRCPDCNGSRYKPETLEVQVEGKSIADVLDLTVSEALAFFARAGELQRLLRPLALVGLDYLKLGQPVPTLSGGEAQRLKLAGHLAEAAGTRPSARGKLFLFDEPTTGLHFDDIAKLLRAFRELLAAGHSIIVIEHNLDVIDAADWIVDLGPEGGTAGGQVVCAGTPDEVARVAASHTGRALAAYRGVLAAASREDAARHGSTLTAAEPLPQYGAAQNALRERAANAIVVHGAREHNLKNIEVDIPRERFTVITGVSGSGKSTLAFDILFAEGQRRYLESLNAYARQFVQPASRPDMDGLYGIPPTVAIEQRTSRGGRKSTVATLTEIYHFLRLMYVKLGTQYCPDCHIAIEPQSRAAIVARLLRERRGQHVGLLAPLVIGRKGYYTDLAQWAAGKGHSHLRVDGEFLPTGKWPRLDRFREHTIELPVADLVVQPENEAKLAAALGEALLHGRGVVHVIGPLDDLRTALAGAGAASLNLPTQVFSERRACPQCGTSFAELDPRLFSFNSRHGWCADCFGTGLVLPEFNAEQSGEEAAWEDVPPESEQICPACTGQRLNRTALAVRFDGLSISALCAAPVADLRQRFETLALSGRAAEVARDIVAEVKSRLGFLDQVGLGYLALDRPAPTLSGGEAQRIRLAAQLGSNLQGVCYILDEPTIGLHTRDNRILLDTLDRLRQRGNTLVVVEHDEDTIRRADHVLDLGPGAGTRGGAVVASGTHAQLLANPNSVTGRCLADPLRHPLLPHRPVVAGGPALRLAGVNLHNVLDLDVDIPLGRLVVMTGVSGSGKSTLARDVTLANLRRLLADAAAAPVGCASVEGWQQVGRVLEVDQTPIGKTPRSCPATYIGFWDAIRKLFADTLEARTRGYAAGRFSFNTAGGRCEHCEGQGVQTIEMSFLPDVKVLCDACGGRRFNPDTLAVLWREKSIGDILQMNVDEALPFFAAHPPIRHALQLLQDVGLAYLTLGQQSPTLSGGEAQRIKLVTELAKSRPGITRPGAASRHTLYVLDEPTVGLHMADVEKLLHVLHRLVDAGNSVVVIEHDLDVIAEADWVIDLGPEGGAGGGRVVASGPPEALADMASVSHTGRALAEFFSTRRRGV
ncbi:MAG: excinuclease ABC subunit UvrA [Rhodocyclaceae bacterium]|nr:excinuclease ABC subunit UvrA [Rhodocyclaceae bacterium]MBX3670710.1 excinuclease ABC subunit UvrA [Rhodocyclaceae bacterium]